MSDKAMVHSGLSASIPVEGGAGRFAELIARLEAAEVGSRELDAEVWAASVGYELVSFDGAGWLYKMHPNDIQRHERTGYINPYTISLDAALALAERVLPGWEGDIEFGRLPSAVIHPPQPYPAEMEFFSVDAKTPALALCIAILKALEAKQ